MQQSLFSGVLIALSASSLAAQATPTPSIQTPTTMMSPQQSITLNGCVDPGATASDPFTLSNAIRLGPMTVPEPGTVSPPAGTATTGTIGTMTSGGTTGATTSVTAGATGTAGVGAPALGTAPGGVPPSTYQLSGTSVSSYVGQSVQVTGMLVPTPNVAATSGAGSSRVARPTGATDVVGATAPPMVPEFRVVKVEPHGIRCPQ